MLLGGGGVGVEHGSVRLLHHVPGFGARVVGQHVFGNAAVLLRKGEIRLTGLNGVDQLVLEIAGQEHVAHHRAHDVIADIGHFRTGTVVHHAVLIHRVGLALAGEGGAFLRVGQQRVVGKFKGKGVVGGGGVHQLLAGDADQPAVGINGVEILS